MAVTTTSPRGCLDFATTRNSSDAGYRGIFRPTRVRPRFAQLLSRLKKNSVKVVRVKEYVANLSEKEMDIVLQALEENTSCQALYLQALSNDQLDCLGSVLQSPGCKIWAVNIGEAELRIDDEMWAQFAEKL